VCCGVVVCVVFTNLWCSKKGNQTGGLVVGFAKVFTKLW
jgi:hypothetical protein